MLDVLELCYLLVTSNYYEDVLFLNVLSKLRHYKQLLSPFYDEDVNSVICAEVKVCKGLSDKSRSVDLGNPYIRQQL